ncbi:unnamed protein product, partial [Discosporangium mesarthrocarpum]
GQRNTGGSAHGVGSMGGGTMPLTLPWRDRQARQRGSRGREDQLKLLAQDARSLGFIGAPERDLTSGRRIRTTRRRPTDLYRNQLSSDPSPSNL